MPTRCASVLVAVGFLMTGCKYSDSYQKLHMQLPTFANMKAMCLAFQDELDDRGCIPPERMTAIAAKYNNGNDAWGNPFLFSVRPPADKDSERCSYLVVSRGRDDKLDLEKIEEYFEHPVEDVVGQFDRDIVFRDGQPVTIASNK